MHKTANTSISIQHLVLNIIQTLNTETLEQQKSDSRIPCGPSKTEHESPTNLLERFYAGIRRRAIKENSKVVNRD